jgi:hypothetical protein
MAMLGQNRPQGIPKLAEVRQDIQKAWQCLHALQQSATPTHIQVRCRYFSHRPDFTLCQGRNDVLIQADTKELYSSA